MEFNQISEVLPIGAPSDLVTLVVMESDRELETIVEEEIVATIGEEVDGADGVIKFELLLIG